MEWRQADLTEGDDDGVVADGVVCLVGVVVSDDELDGLFDASLPGAVSLMTTLIVA